YYLRGFGTSGQVGDGVECGHHERTVKTWGMPAETIHACRCGPCGRGEAHPERERHYQMNLFLSRLDEGQRRWYLALESQRMGWGADRLLMEITGVDEKTIRRGREELAASLVNQPADRVRQPGAGRPSVEKNAGDPVGARGVGRPR